MNKLLLLCIVGFVFSQRDSLSITRETEAAQHQADSLSPEMFGRNQVRAQVRAFPDYFHTVQFNVSRQLVKKVPEWLRKKYYIQQAIIHKGKLYEPKGRPMAAVRKQILIDLMSYKQLPTMHLIYFYRDDLPLAFVNQYAQNQSLTEQERQELVDTIKKIPGWLCSKDLDGELESNKFLFPDNYALNQTRIQQALSKAKKGSDSYPWETKKQIAFWRGQTTGCRIFRFEGGFPACYDDLPNRFPRANLVRLSHDRPDLLDAKFFKPHHTVVDQFNKRNWTDFKSDFVQIQDHLQYKYLLSIDGWSAAWQRVQWIMSSNSLLFKQDSRAIQWYTNRIEKGVHYVPIKDTLSDLFDQIEYYRSHDEEAKAIISNANTLFKKYLTFEALREETYGLFDEFAKIQNLTISAMDEFLALEPEADLFEILQLQPDQKLERYIKALQKRLPPPPTPPPIVEPTPQPVPDQSLEPAPEVPAGNQSANHTDQVLPIENTDTLNEIQRLKKLVSLLVVVVLLLVVAMGALFIVFWKRVMRSGNQMKLVDEERPTGISDNSNTDAGPAF